MTYTEKQLALLEHITDQHNATDITRIPNNYYEQIKTLLEDSIAQAVAEERARVRETIKESQWECPEHGLPKFENTDCVECNSALEINVVLGAILSSLDKQLPDKE